MMKFWVITYEFQKIQFAIGHIFSQLIIDLLELFIFAEM